MPPLSNAHPPTGRGAERSASDEISRQRRDANACLLLGLLSFATLPGFMGLVFLSSKVTDSLLRTVLIAMAISLIVAGISAGVIALVFGRRANQAIRRIEGRIFGDDKAGPGMVLGSIGAGLWSLLIVSSLILPKSHFGGGATAVGPLRTINTAAMHYYCLYGGFPLKLSNLGVDPSKKYDEANDQAAGLIDQVLASGTQSGYRFYYVAGPVDSHGKVQTYTVHADPLKPGDGVPHYYTDQSGVIRQELKRQADANSPPIAGGEGIGNGIDCRDILHPHPVPPQAPPPPEEKIHVAPR